MPAAEKLQEVCFVIANRPAGVPHESVNLEIDEKTERKMFAGLPELGISNGEDLKETLTNCTEPLKAIDQFQVCRLFA